ncbi:MAG: hypothetical protein KKB02_00115 [Alphaproteobacteria bacterium]|nr:hypothetical protein [Alphaproteobacteria bacterium]
MKQRTKTYLMAMSIALCSAVTADAGDVANENILILSGAGSENILTVSTPESRGNTARIFVESADSLLDRSGWQRSTASVLEPGRVLQRGTNHLLDLSVTGESNQVAVSQSGAYQHSSIMTQGRYNIVSVSQAGQFNSASVMQSGLQNTVVISQH